ncbi:MAG: 50S ribosomal protein L19 [Anaerolineae bacterium]
MSSNLLQSVENSVAANANVPALESGDTVRVFFRIIEGNRERIQRFDGVVMRIRRGGPNASFTVRRIGADGVGVERTFPMRSPRIDRVEIVRHAHVRRKNLYYLRERRGKAARLKERRVDVVKPTKAAAAPAPAPATPVAAAPTTPTPATAAAPTAAVEPGTTTDTEAGATGA